MNDKVRRFDKKEIKGAVAVAFPMGNIVFPIAGFTGFEKRDIK